MPRSVPRVTDEQLRAATLIRLHELAVVPAPLEQEAARAAIVQGWWRADGLGDVHVDAVGNVLARLRRGTTGRRVLVAAHLDTVFPADVDHALRTGTDGRLHGPGVGDNTVAVAALAELRHLVPGEGDGHDVWLVATVGEEGLGNLRGAKHLVATHDDLAAFVAVEGAMLGRISLAGNGSVRARVDVHGPGGHSWSDRDRDSAVHAAARAIALLAAERPGREESWSWHVASVTGGGDINVLAAHASFTLEIRAPGTFVLAALETRARELVAAGAAGLAWEWTELGRRPGGAIAPDHPLARAATTAHDAHGCAWILEDAGTDANAALGAGLAALTVGLADGEGLHTLAEWLDPARIPLGLRVLADLVVAAAAAD
ncbi:peptidase M20 [Paraconexibacter algicola]|uniref:Peptidase M20 n=1 Tax=Paraconexibacter algicola TaxID=2133960 RepID=A0A2T4UMD3_9ACTN|nr:peptidase M20 [Paraconexibacter algicola]